MPIERATIETGLVTRALMASRFRILVTEPAARAWDVVAEAQSKFSTSTGYEVFLHISEPTLFREPFVYVPADAPELVDGKQRGWLSGAKEDLLEACAEAQDEGHLPVSDQAKESAERLLSELAKRIANAPLVHSTFEGGIAIDFRNPEREAGVLIVCEPDGSGACYHQRGSKSGRARYSDAEDLLEAVAWHVLGLTGLA